MKRGAKKNEKQKLKLIITATRTHQTHKKRKTTGMSTANAIPSRRRSGRECDVAWIYYYRVSYSFYYYYGRNEFSRPETPFRFHVRSRMRSHIQHTIWVIILSFREVISNQICNTRTRLTYDERYFCVMRTCGAATANGFQFNVFATEINTEKSVAINSNPSTNQILSIFILRRKRANH